MRRNQTFKTRQRGAVLIMVLLFSSLLAVMLLFVWESAILQKKIANNYQSEIMARIKAEQSLNQLERDLPKIKNNYKYNKNIIFLQFVPDTAEFGESLGVDYYRVHSDPALLPHLQSTVAVRRTQPGMPQQVCRKTWEEVRD